MKTTHARLMNAKTAIDSGGCGCCIQSSTDESAMSSISILAGAGAISADDVRAAA